MLRRFVLFACTFLIATRLVAFDEGIEYTELKGKASSTTDGVEVVEFFWYGCPHCYTLEPYLKEWLAKAPDDVVFRRIPAAASPRWEPHAYAFYAAESLGVLDRFHDALFTALVEERRRLGNAEGLIQFAGELEGINEQAFRDAYNSFYVYSQVANAKTLAQRYVIDSVPTLIVAGKYRTSPSQAGTSKTMIEVLDELVAMETAPREVAGSGMSEEAR